MSGYKLHVLDLRGWTPFVGIKKPEPVFTTHATREEAEAARAKLPQSDDVISTITAIAPPKVKGSKLIGKDGLGGRMHSKDRKLTL